MFMDSQFPAAQPGEIIAGKFRVERVLGAGGVGMVVAARHLQLGETVALKFLLPGASREPADIERFIREAQSAVKLKNEHVARIIDVGSLNDGSPYMVMEYLDGQDLGELLRDSGPPEVRDAVDYVLQACEAIAEAHALGIVHRDLKPSNFFLTARRDGSPLVKVLDFGIAKARAEIEQNVSLTQTRTLLGSPVYMSPEQLRSARAADHRSDLWSLGVSLYEMLTDTVPFGGDTVTGVAAAVTCDPLPSVRERRPEVPVGLELVLARCLEKRPDARYQSIAEFAEALVPYGHDDAPLILQRIQGTLGLRPARNGRSTRDTADTNPRVVAVSSSTTVLTHATTANAVTGSRFGLFVAVGLAAISGAGLMFFLLTKHPAPTPVAPVAGAVATALTAPVVTPVAALPVATPVPSPSSATIAGPAAPAPVAVTTPHPVAVGVRRALASSSKKLDVTRSASGDSSESTVDTRN